MKATLPNLIQVGSIVRLHGYKGEVKVTIPQGIILKKIKGPVFIEFAHKPVPFFCEQVNQSPDLLILKLEDINSEEQAKPLLNRNIYIDAQLVKSRKRGFEAENWEGYEVYDQNKKLIGIAKELLNYNQWVLTIDIQGKEAILPVNEETLIEVNLDEKKVWLEIPDGLLDLYLNS